MVSLSLRMGAMVSEIIDINLIRMFKAGPDVSLNGSPTVSPITQALPCSVFLIFSFSQSFFELSQAPPALDIMMASMAPEVMEPANTVECPGPCEETNQERREDGIGPRGDHFPQTRARGYQHASIAIRHDIVCPGQHFSLGTEFDSLAQSAAIRILHLAELAAHLLDDLRRSLADRN